MHLREKLKLYLNQIKLVTYSKLTNYKDNWDPGLFTCYALITLLIAISYRILSMSEACHVKGLIPVWAKHTVGILLFTNMLSGYSVNVFRPHSTILYYYNWLHFILVMTCFSWTSCTEESRTQMSVNQNPSIG